MAASSWPSFETRLSGAPQDEAKLHFPQVITLRPRQRLVADLAERRAAAGVLDPGPREARIEIVAAVHVNRAGLDLSPDALCGVHVPGPDRGGQPVGGVVHQADGLGIV